MEQQCDYCDEGLPIVEGKHLRIDPEGIEGIQRIPCTNIKYLLTKQEEWYPEEENDGDK